MSEVLDIKRCLEPWNTCRTDVSFNYSDLLGPAPVVEKQEFKVDLAGLRFWILKEKFWGTHPNFETELWYSDTEKKRMKPMVFAATHIHVGP